jgi:hypothetical protein
VIAPEALLINCRPRECEVSFFIEEVDSVLAGEFVLLFDIVRDTQRVMIDVCGHDRFCTVY